MTTCWVPGVSADSTFARRLREIVGNAGVLLFDTEARTAERTWRRTVIGTTLQWFDRSATTAQNCPPCTSALIVIDFFGSEDFQPGAQIWQIADAQGHLLLQPFVALALCHREPCIASLVLDETTRKGTRTRLAEACVSSRLPYRKLLNRLAEITGLLVRAALLNRRAGPQVSKGQPRTRVGVAKELLRIGAAAITKCIWSWIVQEDWAIGMIRCSVRAALDGSAPPAEWTTPETKRHYSADPFPWPGRPGVILCERYDHRSGCGKIVALTGPDQKPVALKLGLNCHASYPFTWLDDDGQCFCLPESSAIRQTMLYQLDPAGTAKLFAIIDAGHAIGDPTLFHHEGRYWIAYCDSDLGVHDTLCLLYADRLEGPWTHHRLNPVKIDIRSARPGGTPFRIDGTLYRPAQDCSRTYGGALVINRVVTCTPDAYEETPAAVLRPDPLGPYPDGLHTLSLAGEVLLIDGKRLVASPAAFGRKWRARLRRHFRQPLTRAVIDRPIKRWGIVLFLVVAASLLPLTATAGTLLPKGYLATRGNQIVDERGRPERIAAVGWAGGDSDSFVPYGLDRVNYQSTMQRMTQAGFNTIRLPYCDTWITYQNARPPPGAVNYTVNPSLRGLTALEVLDRIIAEAGRLGLKVIIDHHNNNCRGGQQSNGLWYDARVSAVEFERNWLMLAKRYAGNATVIGFDLDNEPAVTRTNGLNWGQGGPNDIWAMYMQVGNAIQKVDPDVLVICEGPQTYYAGVGGLPDRYAPEGNLSGVVGKPVTLSIPNHVLYSVHEYPPSVDPAIFKGSVSDYVRQMNRAWGYLENRNEAPVWIGEAGSNLKTGTDRRWAEIFVDYLNGRFADQVGPTVRKGDEGVSWCWWGWYYVPRGDPDGFLQSDWWTFKLDQLALVNSIKPRAR